MLRCRKISHYGELHFVIWKYRVKSLFLNMKVFCLI
jgi:hypothetical protein